MKWNDECAIDWTSVTVICGFCDGSCIDKVCGAGPTPLFCQGVMRFGPVPGSAGKGEGAFVGERVEHSVFP